MNHILATAIRIAANAHHGKTDKFGESYIINSLRVMYYVKSDDEELQAIAVLHDVIKDTEVTYQYLWYSGLPERVIEGVRCLTKVKGQTADEYLQVVCSNRDAMLVKLADLHYKLDTRPAVNVTKKDIKRAEKYRKMCTRIKSVLGS